MKKKSDYYGKGKKFWCRNLEKWLLPNNIVRNFFLYCQAEKIVLQHGIVCCSRFG